MGWETYKGLEVPVAPTGDAGINLKDNFKSLADRSLPDGATVGSVMFVGLDGTAKVIDEDTDNFFWDDTNNRLGLGTNTPLDVLQVEGDGKGLFMATGSTAGTSESFITFGAGLATTDQKMRIRFNYGTSDLYLERRDGAGVWTSVMQLSHSDGSVEIPVNLSGNATTGKLQIRDGAVRQSLEVFSYFTSDTVQEGIRIKAKSTGNFELGTFVGTTGGNSRGLTIGNYTSSAPDDIVPWLSFTNSGVPTFSRNNIFLETYANSTAGSIFGGKKARGTREAPTKTLTGDTLTALYGYGYEEQTPGFDTNASAAVIMLASEDFSNVANGTYMIFRTTLDGTTASFERMRIENTGNVGIGTAVPGAKVDIAGNNGTTPSNTLRLTDIDTGSALDQQIGKIEFYSADSSAPGPGVKGFIGGFSEGAAPGCYLGFATDAVTGTPTEKMRITSAGRVGIGTTAPTTLLDVNSDLLRVRVAKTPASATATGNQGDFCWDANFLYICVATNTWRRVVHSTW